MVRTFEPAGESWPVLLAGLDRIELDPCQPHAHAGNQPDVIDVAGRYVRLHGVDTFPALGDQKVVTGRNLHREVGARDGGQARD
jgi:hypothetical protein